MSIFRNIKNAFKNAFNTADKKLDRLDDKVWGPNEEKVKVDSSVRHIDGSRMHVVKVGETLSGISLLYYGNANKYMRIYEANRTVISDPDEIYPGQALHIPDDDEDQ